MNPGMTALLLLAATLLLPLRSGVTHAQQTAAAAAPPAREMREVRRYPAPEARQAVAVDDEHFYAIDNRRIGKYLRSTGARVGGWEGPSDGALQHLNSGIVRDGRLYAAHSNYPERPMLSSIEIWDVASMQHVGSHSFGIHAGSLTWVDRYEDSWWVVFGNYENQAGEPGRGVDWTVLERYDDHWRRTGGWRLPPGLVARFRPYSNSGGSWGADGRLYLTGHDEGELYVMALPSAGSVLEWVATLTGPLEGQGFAWDRSRARTVFGIRRSSLEVVVLEIPGD